MDEKTMEPRGGVRALVGTALMAAVLCVLGPLSVPIGPVPVSLGTLGIYCAVYLLGWRRGALSVLIYLLLGLAGLPVFSGFAGGLARLAGPTGGYLMGFLPMAGIAGFAVERGERRAALFAGLAVGTAVLYAFGTAWYCVLTGSGLMAALALCVLPFIPVDLGKMALAAALCPVVRRRVQRAGMA